MSADWSGDIFATYGSISRAGAHKKVWGEGLSLGALRSAILMVPSNEFPEWANTTIRRLRDMKIEDSVIKNILENMEIARRKRVRESLPINVAVTEFDEHLADLLSRFK